MRKLLILLLAITFATPLAYAGTVAQGTSTDGHRLRLTTDPCLASSGRARQPGWGRTYAWLPNGATWNGCGMLDGDTVLIEWQTVGGTETRRYLADDFLWIPPRKVNPK